MSRTLYLIDGHAQIYRAFFAPFRDLTSPSGEPTRATHVFCQMVLNLLRERRPDYLAMVMDVSDETVFRKEIYPEYKAQREPPPEGLTIQADRIVSILEAARIPILRKEHFEADDIMATLCKRFADEDLRVVLVSKDKDLEQLITDRVVLFDPGKNEEIDAERLFELKGWRPEQAVEAQVLVGDNVDNVPGVPGIGAKTAAKLLEKYGTVAGVIEHADELTPKQSENVKSFAPRAEMVRHLVTLRDDVPIDFDLNSAVCERFAWAEARRILEELGLRRLLEQLPEADSDGAASADETGKPTATAARPEKGGLPARQLARAVRADGCRVGQAAGVRGGHGDHRC